MSPDKLIYMANQIATFFASKPHAEAVEGVAQHINDFWDPRMRAQMLDIAQRDTAEMHPLVVEALPLVRPPANRVSG